MKLKKIIELPGVNVRAFKTSEQSQKYPG